MEQSESDCNVKENKFLSAAECKIEHVLTLQEKEYYKDSPTHFPGRVSRTLLLLW